MLLLAANISCTSEKQTEKVEMVEGAIVKTYKTIGEDDDLKLYIFNPAKHKATDKTPAIVFFHGGGFNGGGWTHFATQAQYLASRGMVGISVQYRTKKSHGTTPFECVKDAKSAMRWVRKNAKGLGIDPKRIAAGGGSAGGHLAAAVATLTSFDEDKDKSISCLPNALVLFNPVFDNGPDGYGYNRIKDRYKEFSPIENIKKGLPPTLVMLGTKDKLLPVKSAKRFKALAEKVGSRCDLNLYEDQVHAFFNRDKNEEMYFKTIYDMDVFLISIGYLQGTPSIDMAS
jgi:acetyl esterase/lipase